jgi:hypothetical protein
MTTIEQVVHLASDLNSSHAGTIATRCRIKLRKL